MIKKKSFRISTHLKDIIGRDLVTNEFVAIFELVKNSFDAGATRVDIEFDPEEARILIVDDGSGMTMSDIENKWLFVAYSEKALTPPADYRDKIKHGGQIAGNKGIGRFSCDTLGTGLRLYSRTEGEKSVSQLTIDWAKFEQNSSKEFQTIMVDLETTKSFPPISSAEPPKACGTVLVIEGTREKWDAEMITALRSDLAKLIDPFGTTKSAVVSTWLIDGSKERIDNVDGPVGNSISDVLQDKTSRIEVSIIDDVIESSLYDRRRKIYTVREPSPYRGLSGSQVRGDIYFLNKSAKNTFTRRMGVRPVSFGSVFLFLNGFRVFPIGEETDDTFGVGRRKQQGQSRFLGNRDIIGRVDVNAPAKMFREVSSRDAGLIVDARSRDLYDAVLKHMIIRLERYVVGVNWQDKPDQNRDTSDGLETDDARNRILAVVGSLARVKDIDIVYYDDELLRISDDPDKITESALKTMTIVAETKGDQELLGQVETAKRRIKELREARDEARAVAKQAIEDRQVADARIEALERQASFLGSSQDVDVERIQLLMHQATIHLNHVRSALGNAAHEARAVLEAAQFPKTGDDEDINDEFEDTLASVRQAARRLSVAVAGGSLSGDRLRTVLSFAPNIRIELDTDHVTGDLITFLKEYFEVRLAGVRGIPETSFEAKGVTLEMGFSPVDMAVMIDNLVDNSRKAEAKKVEFVAKRKGDNAVTITVTDDGLGVDDRRVDASKIFERGYSGSSTGTGLGLYSVREILRLMGGSIERLDNQGRADFEIFIKGQAA